MNMKMRSVGSQQTLTSDHSKVQIFFSFSSNIFSFFLSFRRSLLTANLAQPRVCLGVGGDGLNGHDTLVNLKIVRNLATNPSD